MTGPRILPDPYVPGETLFPIVDACADRARISRRDIMGRSRRKDIAYARGEVMLTLKAMGYSLPVIGRALDRDPTTVFHWIRKGQANG